jgi:hypothetical protein
MLCAPAIVRAESLMPVRGIVVPTALQFGFVQRLYVHNCLPTVLRLQAKGLSAYQIAAVMNAASINASTWDARSVLGVVTLDGMIRRADEYIRWQRRMGS